MILAREQTGPVLPEDHPEIMLMGAVHDLPCALNLIVRVETVLRPRRNIDPHSIRMRSDVADRGDDLFRLCLVVN